MEYDSSRALQLLRQGTQLTNARFREGQEEAIRRIVEHRGRLLVVQKTGWGKSFVYFIATKLLREAHFGPALLISPLLALMRNQIAAAKRMGVCALSINSENEEEWAQIERAVQQDEVDILIISPERLANDRFRTQVLSSISSRVSLLVIDEAHCISDWGHDFRPHYRLLERIVSRLPMNLRLLATTATANNRVMKDLSQVLGPNLTISRGDLNRPSLKLQTMRMPDQAERLAWLAEHMSLLPGSGIIYTLTVRDAVQVAGWLKSRGFSVESYTSETSEGRPELEQALLNNRVKALIATTALGMGFDKSDLGFVIHFQTPGSVVAYYQQVGRAGRALDSAYGVLLSGEEETDINEYFIESAFPTRDEAQAVLTSMERWPRGLTINELLERLNLSRGRIQRTLDLLALESPAPITKVGTRWQLTAANLTNAFWERANRLTELRRFEQKQMQQYVDLKSDHMNFLIRALDGEPVECSQSSLPDLSSEVSPVFVREAVKFLRRTSLPIEPRKRWPVGGMPHFGLGGLIPPEHQASEGRALCVWRDAGWGRLVSDGKYRDNYFGDDLVQGCESMVQQWNPHPKPAWVTCIPSLRHPRLVPDFARRVAAKFGLPFHSILLKSDERPEQKTMANSIQQARNLDGALAISTPQIPNGPVLLIDDMVDSRWTMTIAAWLLRSAGSGPVFPLALSLTGRSTT
jgi:ATP-dependent DNA helicase RecQ